MDCVYLFATNASDFTHAWKFYHRLEAKMILIQMVLKHSNALFIFNHNYCKPFEEPTYLLRQARASESSFVHFGNLQTAR